ncbi:GNAT family N-acetyltransferase [Engelhardtia mirabilis]|uniref:Ribosomal N-acetyltransferase YdaF n=1 Tax=Engelhardtia mirabilis TaxID=2528011 RepID=A0A518BJC4_9BACT|nr:Putative ribosomal N-acetyltransferase YdaF [Planctomycetes bacterium Pla133]QDV01416.1 Putative ribosomal N-acetyltransferase YdaF [Planctomycetes bacterium Pla86]
MSPKPAPRVFLRQPLGADEADFLAAVKRSRKLHRPWTHPPADNEGFRGWLRRCGDDDFEGRLVVDRETHAPVGVYNLSQVFQGNFKSAYMGCYAFEPHQGRGLMGEGLELMLREVFGELRLHRVEANVQPENARSLALVERAGFRREGYSPRYLKIGGRWRDHVRHALTVEDWRDRRRE